MLSVNVMDAEVGTRIQCESQAARSAQMRSVREGSTSEPRDGRRVTFWHLLDLVSLGVGPNCIRIMKKSSRKLHPTLSEYSVARGVVWALCDLVLVVDVVVGDQGGYMDSRAE